jgi:alkylation response protein AidB-like acyl-CoA dehydrogenase
MAVGHPSVEEFQEQARVWLAANRAHAPRDYGPICPPDLVDAGVAWQQRLFDAGYAGIHWPTEFGGRGLSPEHNAVWQLECAIASVPSVFNMVGLVLAGGALLQFGTPEQQAAHLETSLRAEHLWCQLFSEPGAGSDLGGLTTSAVLDADDFVVNGQKVGAAVVDTATGASSWRARIPTRPSTRASRSCSVRWTRPASRFGP